MDLLQVLMLLVIAGICGAIAQWIVAFSPGNLLVSIIVGVIGAYLGALIGGVFPIPLLFPIGVGTVEFSLIWAVVGSGLLLLLLRVLSDGLRQWPALIRRK
ncbi:MAG: GlsB/YeaQ/YmgE family stress response membrane protein [Kouleothrix sp.]|nr:GlsB/YeaQ/YmgE family stress response membrane protein [Kouleothrix sp.]